MINLPGSNFSDLLSSGAAAVLVASVGAGFCAASFSFAQTVRLVKQNKNPKIIFEKYIFLK
jgi:hypothetical protein